MKNWVSRGFISLLIFFSVSGNSPLRAESVSYSHDLSDFARVWDISGTYQEDIDGIAISVTLAQDSAGRISGGGSWRGSEEGVALSAAMTVKGSLTRSKVTKVAFTIQHKGTAIYEGRTHKFSASQKVTAEIDDERLEMTGKVRTSMAIAGQKFSDTEYWSEALPTNMNGSCGLEIESVSGPKGITGAAVMTLSNLRTIKFNLTGSNKKGILNLRLTGSKATADAGSALSMKIDADSGTIQTVKGKVLGQAISGASVTGSVTLSTGSTNVDFTKIVQTDQVGWALWNEKIIITTEDALSDINTTEGLNINNIDFDQFMLIGIRKQCTPLGAGFSIDSVGRVGKQTLVTVGYIRQEGDCNLPVYPEISYQPGYSLSIVQIEKTTNQIVFNFVPNRTNFPPAALAAREALAKQLRVAANEIEIQSAEPVQWSNGCLDLDRSDVCTCVIVPGYRVTLISGGAQYIFHTNANGSNLGQFGESRAL